VLASSLKSYRRVLRTYHLHPEAKFENGDWGDIGPTTPRLIKVTAIRHIGKEAHHWEEEFLLGQDETQFDFGMAPAGHRKNLAELRQAAKDFGHRVLAQAANISRQQLGLILNGKSAPRGSTQIKLGQAAAALSLVKADIDNVLTQLRECIRSVSIRRLADMADIDGGLLSRIVTGERRLSRTTLVKLKKGLALYASYSPTSAHMP
jgi:transcriptional regulator with XRE-family HTH domain